MTNPLITGSRKVGISVMPISFDTVLTSLLSGIPVAILVYRMNESSKKRDRELQKELKQLDINVSSCYKQIDLASNQTAREMEIYKIVYPKKIEAIQSLATVAGELSPLISVYGVTGQIDYIGMESQNELRSKLLALDRQAQGYEWLIGANIITAVKEFLSAAFLLIRHGEQKEWKEIADAVNAFNAAYSGLVSMLRQEMNITDLPPTLRLPETLDKSLLLIEQKPPADKLLE